MQQCREGAASCCQSAEFEVLLLRLPLSGKQLLAAADTACNRRIPIQACSEWLRKRGSKADRRASAIRPSRSPEKKPPSPSIEFPPGRSTTMRFAVLSRLPPVVECGLSCPVHSCRRGTRESLHQEQPRQHLCHQLESLVSRRSAHIPDFPVRCAPIPASVRRLRSG